MRRSSSAFPTRGQSSSDSSRLSLIRGSRAKTRIGGWTRFTILSRHSARLSVRTRLSRSIIDVNRDPSGASLYPGQATTELVPTTTFDGEPLYRPGRAPDAAEIAERRRLYFDPYHAALASEIARLRQQHKRIALFDAHSIRSVIPRLFDGELPVFNLGTNSGASCGPELRETIGAVLAASKQTSIVDGRFKGGWITRAYGRPSEGVEALQLELACRAYMQEPERPTLGNWPTPIDEKRASANPRDNQARARGDSFRSQQLMKTTARCHSRRERSERSGIQRPSPRWPQLWIPRDLRSAENDKFLKD